MNGVNANELDDSTHNSNDVIGYGGTPLHEQTGQTSGCVYIDENEGYYLTNFAKLNQNGNQITIEAWVKRNMNQGERNRYSSLMLRLMEWSIYYPPHPGMRRLSRRREPRSFLKGNRKERREKEMNYTGKVKDILFDYTLDGRRVSIIWFSDKDETRVEAWGDLAKWAAKNIKRNDIITVSGYEKVMKYNYNGKTVTKSTITATRIRKQIEKGKEGEI